VRISTFDDSLLTCKNDWIKALTCANTGWILANVSRGGKRRAGGLDRGAIMKKSTAAYATLGYFHLGCNGT